MNIEGVKSYEAAANSPVYGRDSLGQEDFMALLLKELSYQDPLNPMDSKEFTVQLTQFTSLEELNNINDTLGEVLDYQHSMQNAAVTNMIGKSVRVEGDSTYLNGMADMTYELNDDAYDVRVLIRDASGALVRAEALGPRPSGSNSYVWDGRDSAGNILPDGVYRFEVDAVNQDGNPVDAITKSTGRVTNIELSGDAATLVLDNGRKVYMDQVESIGI